MDMDKLLEAIQILVKEELKEQLPTLIKEGVKAEMKKMLSETKVAQKPQSKGISMAKAILEEEPIQESVQNKTAPLNLDTLANIERVEFSDLNVALGVY